MKRNLKDCFPPFPRTPHLPHRPNATDDDLVASHDEVARIFLDGVAFIYEKVDGSNVGICLWDDHPAVRTKRHILTKGHLGKTGAKNQYRPIWNWAHDHVESFKDLAGITGLELPVVYGEWMYMAHGIRYDALPDLLVAFAVYNPEASQFLPPTDAEAVLIAAGFTTPPLLHGGRVQDYEELVAYANGDSPWVTSGDRRREGIYIHHEGARYKMVREDFERGKYFRKDEIIKNKVKK